MKTGMEMSELFDFSHTVAGDKLKALTYPHEALAQIGYIGEQTPGEHPVGA